MNTIQFYKEENFKEVDGLRVPEDWEVVKLGKVITLKNGKRPVFDEDGIFPVYGANGIMGYSNNYITDNDFILIIGRVGASGEINLSSGKIWVSDNAIYSENYNKTKTFPIFLYYLLRFLDIKQYVTKTTHPIITQTLLKNLKIPLPPLEEQKAIAKILNDFDELIETINKQIEALNKVKKGMMKKLFTKGVFKHEKFKKTEVGEIPEDWDVVKLGDVIKIYDHLRVPLSKIERSKRKGKYPYCGANGIIDYIDNYIFDGEYVLIAEDGGYFGKYESSAYIMKGKFWVNNHAHVIQAINGLTTNLFIMYILNYLDLNPYVVGTTRKKLNQTELKNIKIPLPPLEEQKAIAERLKAIDELIEIKKKEKEQIEKAKKGIMEKLLTGKIRVKNLNS